MNELLKRIHRWLFPPWTNCLKNVLSDCKMVLDLGCGKNSPVQYVSVHYSLGVDLFEPYLEKSRRKGIHSEYILADIRKVEFRENSFDAVLLLDVLEHLTADEGYELIQKVQRWSKKKVVIFTPNGFIWQDGYDNNPLQVHKSGWNSISLKKIGFKVYGTGGWKILKGYKAQPKFKPDILWIVISDITQKITYFLPRYAFGLLGVWEKQHK